MHRLEIPRTVILTVAQSIETAVKTGSGFHHRQHRSLQHKIDAKLRIRESRCREIHRALVAAASPAPPDRQ